MHRFSLLGIALVCNIAFSEPESPQLEQYDAVETEQSSAAQAPSLTGISRPGPKRGDSRSQTDEEGYSKSDLRPTSGADLSEILDVYFDLALYSRPGVNDLTFANFHSFVFLHLLPEKDLEFSSDLSSAYGSPTFFELGWQFHRRGRIRVGKIWIPFDDMDPHQLFSGKSNVTNLAPPGSIPFMPNTWTDHGLGLNMSLVETRTVDLRSYFYVVNGFGGGGSDPNGGGAYPDFGDKGILETDNNRDKAIGARLHGDFRRRVGFGVSYYRGKWDNQDDGEVLGLQMLGADLQMNVGKGTFRLGGIRINGDLPDTVFRRDGGYGEIGWTFDKAQKWRSLLRAGFIQIDSRVENVADQRNVGAKVLYRPSFYQFSLDYSRDLLARDGKTGRTYIASRFSVEF